MRVSQRQREALALACSPAGLPGTSAQWITIRALLSKALVYRVAGGANLYRATEAGRKLIARF